MGYTLNANLQIGDIILIKSSTKFGNIISSVTKGPFSHVGLVFNERKYIEAIPSGVQATSTAQIIVKDLEKVKILRLKKFQDFGLTEQDKKKIVEESNPHRYRKYNFSGAMTSVLEKDIKHDEKKYFCSELVASIYKNIGIKLFDKDVAHVTPNDFLTLIDNLLIDVTDKVFTKMPKFSILYQSEIEYIDEDKLTIFKEPELLTNFFTQVERILHKQDMGLHKIGIFELLEIYDLEDTQMMIFLDSEFAKVYKKININEYIKYFYEKLPKKDFKLFKEDLQQFSSEEIILYLKNQERNKQHNLYKIEEFKAYVMIVNKLKHPIYHEYADVLLEYFEIYLKNTKNLSREFDKEEEILYEYLENFEAKNI